MATSEDELARTATAHDGAPTPDPTRPIGQMIGRYHLERELGQGGMGVVYVAFDPDLERRVALKVLRTTTSAEAAQRLQREARAMARLKHPNVVTVHEVGTANGRDYVAMELIDGETLADWLRAQRRPELEIVDAFVQAGRGLAAAHAAGIVHRDFKPHNVLRAHSGRIEVTDFGLAREAHSEAVAADPLVATLPLADHTATASSTPSSLAGLTVTGSLLGTPAYMAPEQWTGGTVSPATDQFAFSVALWEALAGERPYREPTVEGLRAQILEGPSALDASKLPRRLRKVLLRGLDPDPKRRWPSMAAMLAVLEKRGRGGSLVLAAAGAALVAGAAIAVAVSMRAPSAPGCAPPAFSPTEVWSEKARAALLAAGHVAGVKLLDADLQRWTAARALACAAPIEQRAPALACLDGVLQHTDVAIRAASRMHDVPPLEMGAVLIDPTVCTADRPPRLMPPTPEMLDVMEMRLRVHSVPGSPDKKVLAALAERTIGDPCASAYVHALQAFHSLGTEAKAATEQAEADGERCEDERVRADAAMTGVLMATRLEYLSAALQRKLRHAEVAVQRVAQPDLLAELEVVRMNIALRAENVSGAIARGDAALAGYAARGRTATMIDVGLAALPLLQTRATPADLDEIAKRVASWREIATRELGPTHDVLRRIEQVDAWWSFLRGDVAGAHARLEAARRPEPIEDPVAITGRVVDEAGKPVAGATVVTGKRMIGDAISVAIAEPDGASSLRTVTTSADGTFAIPEAVKDGVVIAQLGDRRSLAHEVADGATLALLPTSRVEGHVDLHGLPPERVFIVVISEAQPRHLRYGISAPVAANGAFSLEGVPRGTLRVMTTVTGLTGTGSAMSMLEVKGPSVQNVQLAAPNAKRTVHVVVRSTVSIPLPNAQVIVRPGVFEARTATGLIERIGSSSERLARPIVGEAAPEAVREIARPDDLYTTMTEVPEGVATACGVGLPADLTDPKLQGQIDHNLDKIELRCVRIEPDAKVVVVQVPPWPRLD